MARIPELTGPTAGRNDPPGPKRAPLVGNLIGAVTDPIGLLEPARECGDVTLLFKRPSRVYLLTHPDHVRNVLVTHHRDFALGSIRRWMKLALGDGLLTSEGEAHLRHRRLIQPLFQRRYLQGQAPTVVDRARQQMAAWRDGAEVEVGEEMRQMALGVALRTILDADLPGAGGDIGRAVAVINRYLSARGRSPLGPLLHRLPLPSRRRFHRARAMVDRTIYELIDRHQSGPTGGRDLLSLLKDGRDADEDWSAARQHMRDEAVGLVAAGHETTANSMTWTWYLLSQNRDAEARLHAEVDSVLAGRTPTEADIPALGYTQKVFIEALRLYPPSWAITRRAAADVSIGGYVIPVGSSVIVSPYLTQRDQRWFPQALEFNPDRWTPEFKSGLPRYAYFPFGGGPRQCIGEPLAWMEAVLALATVASDWRLALVPGYRMQMEPLINLRPKGGMPMVAYRRVRYAAD